MKIQSLKNLAGQIQQALPPVAKATGAAAKELGSAAKAAVDSTQQRRREGRFKDFNIDTEL